MPDAVRELGEAIEEFAKAFLGEAGDAELLFAFSPMLEEEFSPSPEVRDEDSRLDAAGEGKTWVAPAEPVKSSEDLVRDFTRSSSDFTVSYFVDGSVRSVRTCDGIAGNSVFPIVVSQVGAASIRRNGTRLDTYEVSTEVLLLLPLSLIPDTIRNRLKSHVKKIRLEDTLDKGDTERDYANLRTRATRRARLIMAKSEGKVVKKCLDNSACKDYIILDGSLFGLIKEAQIVNTDRVVGVSKSFSMRPLLLAQRAVNSNTFVRKITELNEGERTFAFELHIDNDWVITWYQRIRPRGRVNAPLDGIVKVEVRPQEYKPRGSPNDRRSDDRKWTDYTDYYNQVAKCVYEERFPVPYHEERWHALLYPVYCCEKVLKSSFFSVEVLRGLSNYFLGGTQNGYR